MNTSILLFLSGAIVLFAGVVGYALYLKKNVKAGFRVPFATFSFETSEPQALPVKTEEIECKKTAKPAKQ